MCVDRLLQLLDDNEEFLYNYCRLLIIIINFLELQLVGFAK